MHLSNLFCRRVDIIAIVVMVVLQMTHSAIGQIEEDELVTEYSIVGHTTSISSTVGSISSSTNSDENISTSDDGEEETEARSGVDSFGADSNVVSSSIPNDSTVASDSSSISEGTSAVSSSSTRQYVPVTQTPVIAKRKGVLKVETADVQVIERV